MFTYISDISGSGAKAHYLYKRILETGVLFSELRIFAFIRDEGLRSFYNDLKSFLETSSENFSQNGKNIDIDILPSDDIAQRAICADLIQNSANFIVCADESALNCLLPAANDLYSLTLKVNENRNFEELIMLLSKFGYVRSEFVEDILQFSVRGDIVDIWPAASEEPIRILFEYDRIEVIKVFDIQSQLSKSFLNEIKILSVNTDNNKSTIKEYFSDKSLIFFDYKLSAEQESDMEGFNILINDSLNTKALSQGYKNFDGLRGNISYFAQMIKDFAINKAKIIFYCSNMGEKERIGDILEGLHYDFKDIELILAPLSSGFYLEKENIVYISSREMLYKRIPIAFPKIKGGKRIEGIWEISAGDYAVHEKYGIGRYLGLKTIVSEGVLSEYLCLEYAKKDKLYIPLDNIKAVKKYIGVEGIRPKLYSMDTGAWDKVKSRARQAAKEFAQELFKLYAQRSLVNREPLTEESIWEKELADSFIYQETPDQLKAIDDIKADFSKEFPMERLICGDVGYGKTEIAVRASFKMVCSGKQTAILAPTTILAQQHFETFSDRLSPFPIRIKVLSRFQSKKEQGIILKDLSEGKIDIIIGTHRLLQKDVCFKRLGFLIIDEEHRFGVKQKEKIKDLKKNIDILMLSATPIPRTLSAALSGFRDLSVIETPPAGRLPIETVISVYDDKVMKDVIKAEISRGGQVFYVYNRIETMFDKADSIKKLLPDIKLGIIHGQMKADDIENIMWKFVNREYDVLLATTIIESGLDIPTVNSMIIEDVQNFGLSQLYQLRGRIGRNTQKAYCYMFYDDKGLTDTAVKRLEALKEFNNLGSGFKLALKDLEIRGAGGILSANQHGFVKDVGYDMFVKMLEEEGGNIKSGISDMNSENRLNEIDVEINLRSNALLPVSYIQDEEIRVLFYRKLAEVHNIDAIDSIKKELTDRFGNLPIEALNLFDITVLKLEAKKLNIEAIRESDSYISVHFYKAEALSHNNLRKLVHIYAKSIEFIVGKNAFKLNKKYLGQFNNIEFVRKMLEIIKSL